MQMVSDLVYPFWQLWYLAAMVAWRILAPYWAHLRHPVTAAIILSTLDGFHSPYTYSTQRTTYYFPYFMLGVVIRQDGCVTRLERSHRAGGCRHQSSRHPNDLPPYPTGATWHCVHATCGRRPLSTRAPAVKEATAGQRRRQKHRIWFTGDARLSKHNSQAFLPAFCGVLEGARRTNKGGISISAWAVRKLRGKIERRFTARHPCPRAVGEKRHVCRILTRTGDSRGRYAAPLMELASSGGAAGWAAGMGALQLVYAGIATWNWMPVEYFRGESGYAHLITSGGPGIHPAPVLHALILSHRISSHTASPRSSLLP